MKQRIALLFMVFMAVIFVVTPVSAQITPTEGYQKASSYMVKQAPNPTFGDEWFIIALARGEAEVPANYFETYYQNLVAEVKKVDGNLHARKYTEYSRVILALSAIGKDATNVGGYNLVEKLYDFDQVVWQGLNGPIFALIALDSWNYEIPKTVSNSREKMVAYILSKQLADSGFALSGEQADADVTAMAIQALSSYTEDSRVAAAVESALITLSSLKDEEGFYSSRGLKNSESAAQAILALTSVKVDPMTDARFSSIFPSFMAFYHAADGGFKHTLNEEKSNGMATEQAAYALASYNRFLAGQSKLYDMNDTKKLASKPDITVAPIVFKDTVNHWARAEIEEAVAHGLLKGYADQTFRPSQQLTRVQAVSILVRALDLKGSSSPFTDIKTYNVVTQKEIAAAYEGGLLVKKGTIFAPSEKISREELAVMLQRAYTYKTGKAFTAVKLAPFKDIRTLSAESQQAITFLYDFGIAQGSNGWFNPSNTTTRAHAAKMFVNFLQVVEK